MDNANRNWASRAFAVVLKFLFAGHLVLMMDVCFASRDFSEFDQVERWTFEDLTADFEGHLGRLGMTGLRPAQRRGVGYDETSIVNLAQVRRWAADLVPRGLRIGTANLAQEPAA